MLSAECARCFKGSASLRSIDTCTFCLIWEIETEWLKCIYTAPIKAWMVDDWTGVRAVHLNHHLIL